MSIHESRDVEQALLHGGSRPQPNFEWNAEHMKSMKRTIRALQLDHSQNIWSSVSWAVGFLMILIIPLFRLVYVKAADNEPNHQLIFQPIIVVVGIIMSGVSFIFLSQSTRTYGIKRIIFLDVVEEEPVPIQEEYSKIIQNGALKLSKLLLPVLILYVLEKCWFYFDIPLAKLPHVNNQVLNVAIISFLMGISWLFQTTTFLYVCVLFWKVCALQELRMKLFKESLEEVLAPEIYFQKYTSVVKNLQLASRRFRWFLALTGSTTVFAALASMYEAVAHRRNGSSLMNGELLILNTVNFMGIGLCLNSASKVSHLHKRIIKAASTMHAKATFASPKFSVLPLKEYDITENQEESSIFKLNMENFCEAHDAWSRRAALVNFLSHNSAGISVYGFVLDRFFVHTSIGALLTTTWFILGRSLGS